MKEEDKYNELIQILKNSEVLFPSKKEVGQDVLSRLSQDKRTPRVSLKSFYSWTEIAWLRWSISTAAVLLVAVFFSQQVLISKRLANLEGQLIKTEPHVDPGAKSVPTTYRLILNLISEKKYDSVTVSKDDLELLFKEYMHLQEENKILKKGTGIDSYINSNSDPTSPKTNKNL